MRNADGFTLIELLVVIAIIAIMAAIMMPSYSTTNDRARVAECNADLSATYLGIQMWVEDHGTRPEKLRQLYDKGYVTDDAMLQCTKTGAEFHYDAKAGRDEIMVACVHPDTEKGKRPHSFRQSYVAMLGGGKIVEIGRVTDAVPDYGIPKPKPDPRHVGPPPPPDPPPPPPGP